MELSEPFPESPSYFLPDEGQDGRIYHINSGFSPPSTPSCSFSPDPGCSIQSDPPVTVSASPQSIPRQKFVCYELQLDRSPAVTTCHSCHDQVTSEVTYQVGRHAWLMCLVFVLCGLVLGCCLIPFFMNYFKDAYHTCPRCQRVLHVQRRECYEKTTSHDELSTS